MSCSSCFVTCNSTLSKKKHKCTECKIMSILRKKWNKIYLVIIAVLMNCMNCELIWEDDMSNVDVWVVYGLTHYTDKYCYTGECYGIVSENGRMYTIIDTRGYKDISLTYAMNARNIPTGSGTYTNITITLSQIYLYMNILFV